MHLAQELLVNIQCSGGSRSFAKETRGLKMRYIMAGHWKLLMTNWEHHQKNSVLTILWSSGIWSKLEWWKKLDKSVPHEWVKVAQSCPTLCELINCSPPGSSVHGILQARILKWVATPSSRRSSWPRDQICIFYVSWFGKQVFYH